MGKLDAAKVDRLLPKNRRRRKAGMTSDGQGLYLRVRDSGQASWTFRYRYAARDVWLPLGDADDMPLATARKEARARRVMIDQGKDPLAERRAQEAQEAQRGGFGRVAEAWYEREIEPKYEHPESVRRALDNHILPKLGRKTLQDIAPSDCESVLGAIREDAPTMANDVLRYLKRIFEYARRRHLITTSPVSGFDPGRDAGGRESARTRALSGDELVGLFKAMREAEAMGGDNALAIKLMLALCVRKGELLAARWDEFDLEGKGPKGAVWKLPAERTKTGVALEIPLAPQVAEWLRALQVIAAGSEWVFPKRRRDPRARQEHIGIDTLNVALSRVQHGLEPFTLHDLRRTARTHLAGLGVRTEVAERCLNHKLAGVVGVYDRHDYFTERRQALSAWAAQLARFEEGKSNVVKLQDEARKRA